MRGRICMSDLLKITNYLTEIATQDNHGTRLPIFFTIMDGRDQVVPPDFGDKTIYRHNDFDSACDSIPELYKRLRRYGYTKEETKNIINREEYDTFDMKRVFDSRGMFLTEKEAREHFERNRYHYSKDAHIYCHHAWRAPEMKEFFEALFNHFGIEVKK